MYFARRPDVIWEKSLKKQVLIIWLLLPVFVFAQEIETDPSKFSVNMAVFDNLKTQYDMNIFAQKEFDRADATLNYIYQQILRKYSEYDSFIGTLVKAEKEWLIFRDTHVDSIFPGENKRLSWGSMYPMTYSLELAKITWKRVIQLHRWILPDPSHGSFGCYTDPLQNDI